MNTIGIIGAMEEEISVLKSSAGLILTENIAGIDFYTGEINKKKVIVARCGIGKVNAAICTQVMIDMYKIDCIINVGVAGGLDNDIDIGDIIISSDVIYHDFDTTAFGYEIGYIPRLNMRLFGADRELVKVAVKAGHTACPDNKIMVERIASGDQFIANNETKHNIQRLTDAKCVEMEGAAIGHVCSLNKIPFVIIRSISDKADHNADISFSDFVELAARNSISLIEHLLAIL